jgi:[ribosomal protein S5]-alanine N-acetyltransferase
MVTQTCSFATSRLLAKEWHSLTSDEWTVQNLDSVVAGMLTKRVTRSLPPVLQGIDTPERAGEWISERDLEGTTLLVIERSERMPIGLAILFESMDKDTSGIELRFGYLLAEKAWGKGLATELLLGFVEWCKQNDIASVVGGVEHDNLASHRVLEKAGFICDARESEVGPDELLYRLNIVDKERKM